ncbi:MAG: hypothetical protein ISP84_03660 [Candidatus Poseidonia sp.]|nr:hypothetical protein [Poseidonia sp.]
MSDAESMLDDGTFLADGSPSPERELPRNTEFAERIIRRLNPGNQQEMFEMAARQSKLGGMLITLMVVVWWLFIGVKNDDMSAATSVFFGLEFGQVALAVMTLSVLSAVLSELSKDMGKILPSTVAGGMLILAGLYVAEPLVSAMFLSQFDLTVSEGMYRTIRLGVLWAGMSIGTNLIVNAMLLNWLIRFMDSNHIDFTGRGETSQEMDARLTPSTE